MECLHTFKATPCNIFMNCNEHLERTAKNNWKEMFTVEKSGRHHLNHVSNRQQ